MSGTSADGVDAALVEIQGCGLDTTFTLIEFITYPFPEDVKSRVFQLFSPSSCSVEDVCEMNFVLGRIFAQAKPKMGALYHLVTLTNGKIKPPKLGDLMTRLKTTYDGAVTMGADRTRFIIGNDGVKVIKPPK